MNETGNREMTEQEMTEARVFAGAREFTVGGVLGRTFSTLRANPLVFLGLTLVAVAPMIVIKLLVNENELSGKLLSSIANLLLSQLVQGAMAYAAFQILRGRAASFGESLVRSLLRLGSMIVLSILVGIGIALGVFFLFYIPILIFGRAGLIVVVLFMLPAGFALFCSIFVMIPACLIEGLGPVESINRATDLTKGYRWKVFALFVLAGIAIFLVMTLLPFIVRPLFFWSGMARMLVNFFVLLFPLTLIFLMCPVIYYGLREVKEGLSVESMAGVFD